MLQHPFVTADNASLSVLWYGVVVCTLCLCSHTGMIIGA